MALRYDDIAAKCNNFDVLLAWLRDLRLIGKFEVPCQACNRGNVILRRSTNKDKYVWRCSFKECSKSYSIRHLSWFSGSKLSIETIVKLTYYWVERCSQTFVSKQLSISPRVLVEWYHNARSVCLEVLLRETERIGGPNVEVELDQVTLFKGKGHKVTDETNIERGIMVFGGVECCSKKCFFKTVPDYSSFTLTSIIEQFVLPGTVILSDCWKPYSALEDEGYIATLTASHSIEFRSLTDCGKSSSTTQATWHSLKEFLPRNGTSKHFYDSHFAEYCIRKRYLKSASDPFIKFTELISSVYNIEDTELD